MTYFNMCTNLYVKDVIAEASFFKEIGFQELERENMGGFETVILAPLENGNAHLQLWNIDFIRQVSPEVAESNPSILFSVNNIEEMYSKLKEVASFVGEIQEIGQNKIFNFQTVNGIYMAFSE